MHSRNTAIVILFIFSISIGHTQSKAQKSMISYYELINNEKSLKTLDLRYFPNNSDLIILKFINDYDKLVIGPYVTDFSYLTQTNLSSIIELDASFSNFQVEDINNLHLSNIRRIDLRGTFSSGVLKCITSTLPTIVITEADAQTLMPNDSTRDCFQFEIDNTFRILDSKLNKVPKKYFHHLPLLSRSKYSFSFTLSDKGLPMEIFFSKNYSQADQNNLRTFIKTTLRYSVQQTPSTINMSLQIQAQ